MGRNFLINENFPGYRAREEQTILPPGTLVSPSKNVVINTSGRLQQVGGYAVDGDESQTADNGVQGWYDFDTNTDARRNIRSCFVSSAGNDGKVQFRYKDATTLVVTWKTLISSLASASFSFTSYWDNTDLIKLCLFVNGDGNVYEWNGAVAKILSTTVNTITIAGTPTVTQAGFYTTRNKVLRINGTQYTYTGVSGTTFTGITVDPTGEAVGSVFWQEPVTNAVSGMSPASFTTFAPTLLEKGVDNAIYYGASNSNVVYVSKVNNFKDCSYTSPTRVVAEGYLYILDAPARAFIPQETDQTAASTMLISAGRDYLYREVRTLSADITKETLELKPLRTGRLQAIFDFHSYARTKNGVAFLSNDKVLNVLAQIDNQFVPKLTDLSFGIIDDFSAYTFTGGATFYHKNFIYQSIPTSGIVRAYNMTDPMKEHWESPITYPITGFYVTQDGELGGHAYGSSESYLLFTGARFRANPTDEGFPIETFMYFAPHPHITHYPGMRRWFPNRPATKATEHVFIDGYMSVNSVVNVGLNLDLDGCQTAKTKQILGNDTKTTCPFADGGSFGTASDGTKIFGDGLVVPARQPYFNVVKRFDKRQYRFEQVFFTSYGIDYDWQIISWGTDSMPTAEMDTSIVE